MRLSLSAANVFAESLQAAILIQRDIDAAVSGVVGRGHVPHAGFEELSAVHASAMLHQPHLVSSQDMSDAKETPRGIDGSYPVLSHIPHQACDYGKEQQQRCSPRQPR